LQQPGQQSLAQSRIMLPPLLETVQCPCQQRPALVRAE